MTTRLVVPKFATEAEEAEWWFANRDALGEELARAAQDGTLRRRSTRDAAEAAAAGKHTGLLNLTDDDLLKAHEAARRRGVTMVEYLRLIVHEALEREPAA